MKKHWNWSPSTCAPLAPRRVPLGEAAGLVLAEDIASDVNSPPYDKALMDGYAVRSGDREPERRILEEIAAGAVPRFPVTPGTASRIMTGAPLPEGADAVVPVEQTELVDDATVRLQQVDPRAGQERAAAGRIDASRRRRAAAGRRAAPDRNRDPGRNRPRHRHGDSAAARGRSCRPATSWSPSARSPAPGRFATATDRCWLAAARAPAPMRSSSASRATTATSSRAGSSKGWRRTCWC